MERPGRFSEQRYLGDKRTQVAYDVDEATDGEVIAVIEELAAGPFAQTFGPDTRAEARNRGYRFLRD